MLRRLRWHFSPLALLVAGDVWLTSGDGSDGPGANAQDAEDPGKDSTGEN
jgi:hypothetical protein